MLGDRSTTMFQKHHAAAFGMKPTLVGGQGSLARERRHFVYSYTGYTSLWYTFRPLALSIC